MGSAFHLIFLRGEDSLCGLLHPPRVRTAISLFFFLISLLLSVTSSDTNSTSVTKRIPSRATWDEVIWRTQVILPPEQMSLLTKILCSYTVSPGFNNPALAADQETQLQG